MTAVAGQPGLVGKGRMVMVQRGSSAKKICLALLGLIVGFGLAWPAQAHFQVFWPQVEGCYARPGEAVTWRYFWGHPFEMLISDAQPAKFFVFTPKKQREKPAIKEITLKDQASGQDRKAFEVEYTPAGPGDYYLCLESPAYFIPEDQVFWQDYVKEPLHVVPGKGWDQLVGLPMEIVPLTRPYGWPAGSVFKGQALAKNLALTRATVEIEKLNGFFVPPDRLPKDRLGAANGPLITRVTRTDNMGYFVCTLDSPGWWLISVSAPGGKKVHEGKTYPVEMRGGLWVYVEPPPPALTPPAK
jgi:cobalt/nickel transport protein